MAQKKKCRIVFMGTPDFSAMILNRLAEWPYGEIVAVYTQPDRPSGRGQKLMPSPVKQWALERNVPIRQPVHFKADSDVEALAALEPDVLVVAAYGLILPQSVLDIPKIAPVNVHASLLPYYRGAAPIQRAIMENWQSDAITGVSIMRMERGLDSGPVYATASLPIGEHTAGSMHDALAELGVAKLLTVLEDMMDGIEHFFAQDTAIATYAPKMQKSDGMIQDWSRPAAAVHAHIRGVTPWPGARAYFLFHGQSEAVELALLPGRPISEPMDVSPGQVFFSDKGLMISCSDGWYRLGQIKARGRKFIDSGEYVNGYLRLNVQGKCGTIVPPPLG